MTKSLDKLIEAVETGNIESRFDPRFERAIYPGNSMHSVYYAGEAYYGSLDAAKALHEALLPGWGWRFSDLYGDGMPQEFEKKMAWVSEPHNWRIGQTSEVKNNNPARAWLLAILKAYRETRKEST